MKKIFALLLVLPFLSYSSNNSLLLLSKNKYNFVYETKLDENSISYAPQKRSSGGGSISDVPWLVSGGMVLVGGAMAIIYGYNHKNQPSLAVTGGAIAIVGGALATIRVFALSKKGRLFGLNNTTQPNTAVAINLSGVKISHRF